MQVFVGFGDGDDAGCFPNGWNCVGVDGEVEGVCEEFGCCGSEVLQVSDVDSVRAA